MTALNARQRKRKLMLLISLILFPVTLNYFSPYIILDGAAQGIIAGSLLVFVSLFISSLFVGRAFCGWLCPAGALQEYGFFVNRRRFRKSWYNRVKYFIFGPWIILIITLFVLAGGIKAVDPFHLTDYGISFMGLSFYFVAPIIVALFLIIPRMLGKRAACHTICWMAPFMVAGNKIRYKAGLPGLKLKRSDTNKCGGCGRCSLNCPMSLDVMGMVKWNNMYNPECILCGVCVDGCPDHAIEFTYGSPNEDERVGKKRHAFTVRDLKDLDRDPASMNRRG